MAQISTEKLPISLFLRMSYNWKQYPMIGPTATKMSTIHIIISYSISILLSLQTSFYKDLLSFMIKAIIVGLLVFQVLTQVTPPVWPEVFHQSYVESYNGSSLHTTGRIYYDAKRGLNRVDRQDGVNQLFCGSILPNISGPCTHLVRDKKRYIIHQQRRMCCMCCDEAHGCGVPPRDWLKQAKYLGEETLSGESFNKWGKAFGNSTDYYYATKTDQRIPRRFVDNDNKKTQDFLMNTYSTDPIPDSVFILPDYCKNACPATTICGKLQSKQIQSDQ